MIDRNRAIGEFFTWGEFVRADVTSLPEGVAQRLVVLVATVLDPLRTHLGKPIRVTSGYRTPEHNTRIGGSRNSAHMRGEAADIAVRGIDAHAIMGALRLLDVDLDQAIAYAPSRGGHVHVGIARPGVAPRRQWLWAPASGGYEPYRWP